MVDELILEVLAEVRSEINDLGHALGDKQHRQALDLTTDIQKLMAGVRVLLELPHKCTRTPGAND